jgi:hypothetical protein
MKLRKLDWMDLLVASIFLIAVTGGINIGRLPLILHEDLTTRIVIGFFAAILVLIFEMGLLWAIIFFLGFLTTCSEKLRRSLEARRLSKDRHAQ